jgi:hypothetical protein
MVVLGWWKEGRGNVVVWWWKEGIEMLAGGESEFVTRSDDFDSMSSLPVTT